MSRSERWSSSHWPATSFPSRSTSQPPRSRRPCVPSCLSPSNWAGSFACLNDGLPDKLEVEFQGGLAGTGTSILTLSVLKGLFAAGTEEPVSYVNAPQLAEERGLEVREVSTTKSQDYVNLITLRSGDHSVAGTLTGPKTESRLVMMDDHAIDVPPSPHMLVVRNDDRPGMIGVVGP